MRARALGGTDARVTHESLADELGKARDVQAKNSRVLKIQTSNIEDLVKQNEERRAQRTLKASSTTRRPGSERRSDEDRDARGSACTSSAPEKGEQPTELQMATSNR